MQTLSRYFVAFLLILVSHFIEDADSEKETRQVYKPKTEIQKVTVEKVIVTPKHTLCS